MKLAQRAGFRCSNPECRCPTSGADLSTNDRSVNIGVAAHITAASPGGPRYDPSMPSALRSSIDNGIWCCYNCSKLIDDAPLQFPSTRLHDWKRDAEMNSLRESSSRSTILDPDEVLAQQDILLGALDGHEGNMIVFGQRNGWDVVTLAGEHYNRTQDQRSLYVEAMLQLLEQGLVRRRGGLAFELTYSGLKKAKLLFQNGQRRRQSAV